MCVYSTWTRVEPLHTTLKVMEWLNEWMNSTMQHMLAKYVSDHQHNWDEHLPTVMMASCSSVHASMQYTPFYILFGH